jgi:Spy/CpxP family protein refolding chaperone
MFLIRVLALSAAMLLTLPAQAATAPATAATAAATEQSAELQDFIQQLRAGKRQLVTDNLSLTVAEGNQFWPLYEQYQSGLSEINQRMMATLKSYADAYNAGPVSDADAKQLLDESLALEVAELQLKQTFVPQFEKALPAAKVARYIQIEQKIRAAIRYELALGVPLAE